MGTLIILILVTDVVLLVIAFTLIQALVNKLKRENCKLRLEVTTADDLANIMKEYIGSYSVMVSELIEENEWLINRNEALQEEVDMLREVLANNEIEVE